MRFDLDETQRVIAASATEVLAGAGPEPGDLAAWQALAKAGLLALTLPGWMGGDGLGVLEAAVLLTEVGRRAADVPALATIMLGTLPIVRWADRELARRALAGVGEGETILSAAVREWSSGFPAIPATVAVLDRTGHRDRHQGRGAVRWPGEPDPGSRGGNCTRNGRSTPQRPRRACLSRRG